MFRNVASDGLVFNDPVNPGIVSAPGCVLASPSWENTATQVTQDYVYHWTRDAAIVALELSAAYTAGMLPTNQPLIDYVTFSATCQASPGDFDRASFRINGDAAPVDRPDRRPGAADGRPAGAVPAARRPDPGDRDRPDQRQPRVPVDRLPGPDLQPVGRGVRLLLLRPLGPAALLPGGRRQRRRHRGPELAPGRADLARERARRALERPVLPVDAPGPDRLPRPLRPEHRHRPGGDLRRRVGHRPPAAGDRGAAARPVGRLVVGLLLPDQRRRRGPGPRPAPRPLPGRRLRRRHRRPGRRPSVGAHHRQLRRALLPSRSQNHFIPNGPGRLSLRPVPRPGRHHVSDRPARRGHRPARRGRRHARRDHRPQRPLRAQRAVRRVHRLREERQQPLLVLRRLPLRHPRPPRHASRPDLA